MLLLHQTLSFPEGFSSRFGFIVHVGVGLICAVHGGDHEGYIPLHSLALLPGHILAVVVASPHLLAFEDLPDGGAVLLGDVMTLVHLLRVNLRLNDLDTGLESLVSGYRVTFVQLYIVHHHLALSEQFDLQGRRVESHQSLVPNSYLALEVSDVHTLGVLLPLAVILQSLCAALPWLRVLYQRSIVLQGLAVVLMVVMVSTTQHTPYQASCHQ